VSEPWAYQIRLYLSDALAETARSDPDGPALRPLTDILRAHDATLKSQFDAFADYVAEAEAGGVETYPLYRWTKATLEDAEKAAKHRKAFAIRVEDREVYAKDIADALEAALQPLVDGKLITRLSRHDTNPANNIPVPEHLRA
jgi:plasmid stabilization system protein ParE